MAVSAKELQPGVPMPPPVRERPPADRFCDLVLTGGIASGIVYPWAVVELARHYRFRSIGGNSVGGMAAAFAAAAEYGRCCGHEEAFEPLRHSPHNLAEEDASGRTRMLRLFQPDAGVHRLFECLLIGIRHFNSTEWLDVAGQPKPPPDLEGGEEAPALGPLLLTIRDVMALYGLGLWWLAGMLVLLLPAIAMTGHPGSWLAAMLAATGALVALEHLAKKGPRPRRVTLLLVLLGSLAAAHGAAALFLGWALRQHTHAWGWSAAGLLPMLGILGWTLLMAVAGGILLVPELRALKRNGYGLCPGRAQAAVPGGQPAEKAIVEWLHEGIQRSAGREKEDAPLTFSDLWSAPRGFALPEGEESIRLQVFSTNVTLGRPVVWPLKDPNVRLFYRYDDWARIFPPTLLDALWENSRAYRQEKDTDPPEGDDTCLLRELPAGGMPIAVAARLTLSFPLLFSCVPVYAVDYEELPHQRVFRPCLLTDGGVCTNFPIHLFDEAHPASPTFGLLLSRRIARYADQCIWLPDKHGEGRADNWSRGVPGAERGVAPGPVKGLIGLLAGMLGTALRWNDNLLTRLPHVRNRVLRMALQPGEGQLHLTMPREVLLNMAHEYGTLGGRKLADQFVGPAGQPSVAWQEHLYVRSMNELRALGRRLSRYRRSVSAAGFNKPLARVLADAMSTRPLRDRRHPPSDVLGDELSPRQEAALQEAVARLGELAQVLEDNEELFGPYRPVPPTHLHLRSEI